MLGYNEGELLGQNWIDSVVPPEEQDELKDYFYHILSDNIEQDDHYTNYVTTKSGEPRLIDWRNRLLRNEAGLPIGILSSGWTSPISERWKTPWPKKKYGCETRS